MSKGLVWLLSSGISGDFADAVCRLLFDHALQSSSLNLRWTPLAGGMKSV